MGNRKKKNSSELTNEHTACLPHPFIKRNNNKHKDNAEEDKLKKQIRNSHQFDITYLTLINKNKTQKSAGCI